MLRLPLASIPLLAAFAALTLSTTAAAVQHLVRPGDDWGRLKEKVQAGDEIILLPGTHRPVAFDGLAGEAGKPIVIRPVDLKVPVTIEASDIGIALRRARFLRIESLVILNARRAGILIQGAPESPAEGIELRNVYVAKTGDLAEQAAIRIERGRDIEVTGARIEGWHRAGIHVQASERVRLDRVQFVGAAATPEQFAIAVDGRSQQVTVERCRFGPGIGVALAIGLSSTDEPPPLPVPAEGTKPEIAYLADGITMERCLAERIGRLVAVGSARSALIRANTVSEVEIAYEISAPPKGYGKVADSMMLANLITWSPGAMKRFSTAAPDVDPSAWSVDTNLWWSVELAAAKNLLGDWVGTVRSPQLTTVDPELDGYLRPRSDAAKAFGMDAP